MNQRAAGLTGSYMMPDPIVEPMWGKGGCWPPRPRWTCAHAHTWVSQGAPGALRGHLAGLVLPICTRPALTATDVAT
jgi:hypothetical protein